jgi:hypothetical protein
MHGGNHCPSCTLRAKHVVEYHITIFLYVTNDAEVDAE